MKDFFDSTRVVVTRDYAVLPPGSLAPSLLPGWEKALCHVPVSPTLGARFCQFLVTLQADGLCQGNTGRNQLSLYMLEGNASIQAEDRRHRLEPGSFAYVPAERDVQIKGAGPASRMVLFQKPYQPLPGAGVPAAFVTHEREVKGQALAGAPWVRLQALLPSDPAFDMAVNLLSFEPGGALPAVAARVTEHGLLILRGQGVLRLGADWHPVRAGDAIWTASYCPFWFAAIGREPASYISYQDANRDPM